MKTINKNEISDYELIDLYNENDEEAKNILYQRYGYIINLILNKHRNQYYKLRIDEQELYSEATLGFSDALNNYRDDKETSLPTFITLCVERKLYGLTKKYMTKKHQVDIESISLDSSLDDSDKTLLDVISDNGKNDPLNNLEENDNYNELNFKIARVLSKKEYEVYALMLKHYNYKEIAQILNINEKQVDNAIQRIKNKVKSIINSWYSNDFVLEFKHEHESVFYLT